MGLGLSRTTAIALSEFIPNDSFTEAEALQWLRENDYQNLSIPNLVKKEIVTILGIQLIAQ